MKAFFTSSAGTIYKVLGKAYDVAIFGDKLGSEIEGIPLVVMGAIGALANEGIDTLTNVER